MIAGAMELCEHINNYQLWSIPLILHFKKSTATSEKDEVFQAIILLSNNGSKQ